MATRDEILSLAAGVNDLLRRYVEVHNDVFSSSLRRVIPIPGLFQAVDFCSHRDTLAAIHAELGAAARQGQTMGTRPAVGAAEQQFLVGLDEYVLALTDTVSRLGDICEQLCTKQKAAASYRWGDYDRDVEDYKRAIARYKALGGRLNHLYQALEP